MRGSMIEIDRLFITPSLSSIGIGVYTRCTHTKRWYTIFYSIRIGALTAYISRSAPLEVKWDRYIITISSGQWHPKEGSSISGVICRECRFPPTAEIAECPERLKFVLVGGPGAEGSKKKSISHDDQIRRRRKRLSLDDGLDIIEGKPSLQGLLRHSPKLFHLFLQRFLYGFKYPARKTNLFHTPAFGWVVEWLVQQLNKFKAYLRWRLRLLQLQIKFLLKYFTLFYGQSAAVITNYFSELGKNGGN